VRNLDRRKLQNPSHAAEPLLDVKEVCELLQVPPSTIYQLTHRGRIPHFKIANRLRFRRSEVLAWIEDHRGRRPEKRS